jgi:hypothetical protein
MNLNTCILGHLLSDINLSTCIVGHSLPPLPFKPHTAAFPISRVHL